MSESGQLRKHYFLDEYVIIAPKRAQRPGAVSPQHQEADTINIAHERAVYQLKDQAGDWLVKVIANKYPALTPQTPAAYGKQEVIIETPEPEKEFSELSLGQIERVFSTYIKRTLLLYDLKGIRYVSVFKNDGPKAGASVRHAHSQIIALPIVPPKLQTEATAAATYANQHGRSVYGDVIRWEQNQKQRVVHEDAHIIAICPYASQNPYELWILPKSDTATFAALTGAERHAIAVTLKNACAFLDKLDINFNYFLQDAVMHDQQRFVLKIEPRKTVWAGLELATGVIINPVAPEQATKEYQKFFESL